MAATINIIVIALSLAALAWGAWKGLTTQLVSILGIFLGIWLAANFTPTVAEWVQGVFGENVSMSVIKIIVYALIVIAIIILCHLIGRVLDKVMKLTVLGAFNTIFGAVFCLAKVLFVLAVIASILDYCGIEGLKESSAFRFLLKIADIVFPFIKRVFSAN